MVKQGRKGRARGRDGAVDAMEAAELLEELQQSGRLSGPTLLRLLGGHQPVCEPSGSDSKSACKGKKDNPNCLCGLIPLPGSYRKKGLWQKEPSAVASLGADPNQQRRTSLATPAGLNNLGNTCYVNSALQCLFNMPELRSALYRVGPPVAEHQLVQQMRDLFLRLQFGPHSVVDSRAFASCLQLDHAVQQDGQEFFKLVINKLESLFASEPDPSIRQVIRAAFRGSYAYVTTCSRCGQPSESSAATQDFYELPLQVQNASTLMQSLVASLTAEHLTGANQYLCEGCGLKCDATRQMVLRSAPPYLCLALQRFLFDYSTMDKMKASDKLSFPLRLDLDQVLCMASESGRYDPVLGTHDGQPVKSYQLAAVLIHKGTSASHGHYVAHIRDAASGRWWRFDDESVTEMGQLPTGFPQDHGAGTGGATAAGKEANGKEGGNEAGAAGSAGKKGNSSAAGRKGKKAAGAATAASGGGGRPRGGKRKASGGPGEGIDAAGTAGSPVVLDGGGADAQERTPNGAAISAGEQQGGGAEAAGADGAVVSDIVSSNAYMLLYVQDGYSQPALPATPQQLPGALPQAVEDMEQAFNEACVNHVVLVEQAKERAQQRRQDVQRILSEASVRPEEELGEEEEEEEGQAAEAEASGSGRGGEHRTGRVQNGGQGRSRSPSRWISAAWLQDWANEEGPPAPIDNAPLQCPHGRLDPGKVQAGAAKRISAAAWAQLHVLCTGGPEFATSDACTECLAASMEQVTTAEQADSMREAVLQMLKSLPDDTAAAAEMLEGEEAYYVSKTWLHGWQHRKGASMSAVSPTEHIACPHGNLMPECSAKCKRAVVSREVWLFLRRAWEREQAAKKRGKPAAQRPGKKEPSGGATPNGPDAAVKSDRAGDDAMVVDLCVDSPARSGQQQQQRPADGASGGNDDVQMVDLVDEPPPPQQQPQETPQQAPQCTALPVGSSEDCAVCLAAQMDSAQLGSRVRRDAEAERQALGSLLPNSLSPALEPGCAWYYLLPASWLKAWQAYITAATKRGQPAITAAAAAVGSAAKRPPPVAEALQDYLCTCCPAAPGLAMRPPAVALKRNKWIQEEAAGGDAFRLVSEEDWASLQAFYPLPEEAAAAAAAADNPRLAAAARGVRMQLAPALPAGQQQQQQRGASPAVLLDDAAGEPAPNGAAAGGDSDWTPAAEGSNAAASASAAAGAAPQCRLVCEPDICAAHIAAVEREARQAQLVYKDVEVLAEVIKREELPTAFLQLGTERKSKRARKGRAPLKVDSTNTLRELKYKVFEALGLHPANQEVYVRGACLDTTLGDDATLAQCEIFAGEEIRIVSKELVDDNDLTTLFDGYRPPGGKKKREKEMGFANTLLTEGGGTPAAATTAAAAGDEEQPASTKAAAGEGDDGAGPSRMDVGP